MAKRKIDFNRNLKVYWSFLSKYKWLFIVTVLVVLLSEALNFSEKFLFKVVVDRGTAYGANALTLEVITTIFFWIAVVYLVSIVLKACVKWLFVHLINILETRLVMDLKQRFFNHIISLSHGFHVTHKTGSLIARIGRGAGAMERMTDFIIFNTFSTGFQVILTGLAIFYFDKLSTLIVFATIACFVGYGLTMQHIQKKYNERYNRAEDIEKGNLSDFMTNVDSIKYFGSEKLIKSKYGTLTSNSRSALMKFEGYYRWLDSGQNVILWTGTFLLMFFSLKSFLAGNITLGTIVLIYTAYGGLVGHIYGFMHGIRSYYRSMVDFHDLFEYGKVEQEVKDKEDAIDAKIEKGMIEYSNVAFNYKEKRKIFSNFSLKINPGEKVAFVGHSGSGKTTLIKLLYRFYDATSGAILIDAKNIKDFNQESLRSELSIVPQEGVLFDDTIYNNIKFSNPQASQAEVMKAIKFAQLDKLISSLPKKENTIVGERGVKLSGGERQRVSIARALLANKRVIVLDEATSSLDSQTEHSIQADLKRLLEGRTALIIAHRLSTIMHADKIVVLEKGKIVQMGRHNELIRQPGLYKKLWSLQKGGYIQD